MELTRAICTTCGANVNVDTTLKKGKCVACGNTYLVSHAMDLKSVEVDKTKDLKNYRFLLNRAVKNSDYDIIRSQSKGILEIIPDDFKAQYYFAFAAKKKHAPRALNQFYKMKNIEATDEALTEVISHIIKQGDLSDYALIKNFITNHAPNKIHRYEEFFARQKELENNYSVIPRDAFICHRSIDRRDAEAVVTSLENNGHDAWISYRNLRPNDNENYWNNIEAAIDNCKVFVVVSSNEAMLSKDVQKELDIAAKLKKPRLEFKIDEAVHTSLFKHFFDGNKWINATTDVKEAFTELNDRFFDLIQTLKEKPKKSYKEPTKIENYIKRAQISLSHRDYRQADEFAEHALDLDVEQSEAWYIKFLAQYKFKNTKQFIEFVNDNDDLTSIIDIIDSASFASARKFSEDQKRFEDLTTMVKKRITQYVDQVKLDTDDNQRYLKSIIRYQPENDIARFKLFLFKYNIPSISVFKSRLRNIDQFFETEAIVESDAFKSMMKNISDESLLELPRQYYTFKNDLGIKAINKMRKNNEKRERLVKTINHLLSVKKFKKAKASIKKLSTIDDEAKYQAYYYKILADNEIRDNNKLKDFLKVDTNHNKIKQISQSKPFKQLKNSPQYSDFIEQVELAIKQTKYGLKDEKIRKKINKVKKSYRVYLKITHFIIGISLLFALLMTFSIFFDINVFTFRFNHHLNETFYYVEIGIAVSFFLMAFVLLLREISLFRIRLHSMRFVSEHAKEKINEELTVSPFLSVLFLLATIYFGLFFISYITQDNLYHIIYFPDVNVELIMFVYASTFIGAFFVYLFFQKRIKILGSPFNSKSILDKVFVRVIVIMVIVLMINFFIFA